MIPLKEKSNNFSIVNFKIYTIFYVICIKNNIVSSTNIWEKNLIESIRSAQKTKVANDKWEFLTTNNFQNSTQHSPSLNWPYTSRSLYYTTVIYCCYDSTVNKIFSFDSKKLLWYLHSKAEQLTWCRKLWIKWQLTIESDYWGSVKYII